MIQFQAFRTFARSMKILLMFLLIGFELIPALTGGDMASINQAALQLTRSQIITNAAYTLVYRLQTERAQALRDLQNVLPPFKYEQAALEKNATTETLDLLQQARADYLPLLAAAQIMMAHPDTTSNSIELAIIVSHDRSYLLTMNLLLLVLPRSFEARNIQLFVTQLVAQGVFVILFLLALMTFVWERHMQTGQKTKILSLKILISRKAIFVFSLLFLLLCLEMTTLRIGDEATFLNQAALQRTRCEIFAKSAFTLAYHPVAEKTLAVSDVQFILPLFQQEQDILLKDQDVQSQVQQATIEYQTMVAAVQALAARPGGEVDPAVVTIVLSHAPTCLAVTDMVVSRLQDALQQRTNLIFFAEVFIESAFIIFFGSLLLLSREPFKPNFDAVIA